MASKLDEIQITVKPEYPFAYGDTLAFNLPHEAKQQIKDLMGDIYKEALAEYKPGHGTLAELIIRKVREL